MPNDGEKSEEQTESEGLAYSAELLDRYFEFFKHLTTLNSGAVLISLAIYQAAGLEKYDLVIPLLMFGASLVIALHGMYGITMRTLNPGRPVSREIEKYIGDPYPRLIYSGMLFFFGLLVFAVNVVSPPIVEFLKSLYKSLVSVFS